MSAYNLALFSVPHFRVAMRGVQERGLSATYSWKKVHRVAVGSTNTSARYRLTWV